MYLDDAANGDVRMAHHSTAARNKNSMCSRNRTRPTSAVTMPKSIPPVIVTFSQLLIVDTTFLATLLCLTLIICSYSFRARRLVLSTFSSIFERNAWMNKVMSMHRMPICIEKQ